MSQTAELSARRVRLRVVTIHGREVALSELHGVGSPILLVHGIGSSSQTWGDVPMRLAQAGAHVLAVDLPGHGNSSKQPGDYSLGAMASTLRDLLDQLGHQKVHLVGHSLGGGICLQFAYQFPERVEDLVLVSSGGLGREAFLGLRAAAMPGSDLVMRLTINRRSIRSACWIGRTLATFGLAPQLVNPAALKTAATLASQDNRRAFLSTLRSVVNVQGQRVSALDKLHLLDGREVLIIWGDHDSMIPVKHGENCHELLPGSRLVIFPGASHEPHAHDPQRFAQLVYQHTISHASMVESGDIQNQLARVLPCEQAEEHLGEI